MVEVGWDQHFDYSVLVAQDQHFEKLRTELQCSYFGYLMFEVSYLYFEQQMMKLSLLSKFFQVLLIFSQRLDQQVDFLALSMEHSQSKAILGELLQQLGQQEGVVQVIFQERRDRVNQQGQYSQRCQCYHQKDYYKWEAEGSLLMIRQRLELRQSLCCCYFEMGWYFGLGLFRWGLGQFGLGVGELRSKGVQFLAWLRVQPNQGNLKKMLVVSQEIASEFYQQRVWV